MDGSSILPRSTKGIILVSLVDVIRSQITGLTGFDMVSNKLKATSEMTDLISINNINANDDAFGFDGSESFQEYAMAA